MEKIVSLFISFTLVVSLCSCSNTTPLKEKLIVEGIAVDEKDGQFSVSLQVYSASADTTTQNQYQIFEAAGNTLYEALKRVDENTGKRSYFSDTKVIAFSYNILQKGLRSNLDYFIRSSEIGSNVCLAATMGEARDLFTIEKEGINMPSKVLSNALYYGKSQSTPISGELMTVSSKLAIPNADISIPLVEITKDGDKKSPVLNGILCFKDNLPCYSMNELHKWAYNWLHGYQDNRAFVLTFEEDEYSMKFRKTTRKVKVSLINGHPHFDIQIGVECDIAEIDSAATLNLTQLSAFKEALANEVEEITLLALHTIFLGQQCDVFDLGRNLKKQQPEFYKSLEDWRAEMLHCTFECKADIAVIRAGQGSVEK